MEKKKPGKQQNQKSQSRINPLSFNDVPGLGPVAIKLLKKEGYENTLQLICKTPTFLKEVTAMDKDKVGAAFAFMRKHLVEAGYITKQELTATELLKIRRQIKRVSIGCESLDNLLNGGIECKSITEFYGENASGKTQLSHSMAIQVQRPIKDGGLLEDLKNPPFVLWFDTEGTCRPERFISILAGKKLIDDYPADIKQKLLDNKDLSPAEEQVVKTVKGNQEKEAPKYLDRIIVQKASNAYAQFILVQNAMQLCQHINIKIIIIDSGTALFRSDYLGRGNTKAKFDLLNEMIHDLKAIAENYNIPIIFINQIYHSPEQSFGKDEDIPYGGNIIGHAIPYRIKLEHFIKTNKATIMKSPYQANNTAVFKVTDAGVVDVE